MRKCDRQNAPVGMRMSLRQQQADIPFCQRVRFAGSGRCLVNGKHGFFVIFLSAKIQTNKPIAENRFEKNGHPQKKAAIAGQVFAIGFCAMFLSDG